MRILELQKGKPNKDGIVKSYTLVHIYRSYYVRATSDEPIQYELCEVYEKKGKKDWNTRGWFGKLEQLIKIIKERVVLENWGEDYQVILNKLITINKLIQQHDIIKILEENE